MKLSIQREVLLGPLQRVIGAVERRQTQPALGNILIRTEEAGMSFTATDLEVELVAFVDIKPEDGGDITVPARKFVDICKALPSEAGLNVRTEGDKLLVQSGRSRYTLATLPAAEFPALDEIDNSREFEVAQGDLKHLIERTAFAMANQDVRYYLNGLMLEIEEGKLRAVATDGHRLAMCVLETGLSGEGAQQIIVPRKGIQELLRLLEDNDEPARVNVSANHIRVNLPQIRFTSKLIDGRFPDYQRVLPKGGDKILKIERNTLKQALTRASILSNEKYKGIRLNLGKGLLKIQAHNPEQEEAEEELEVDYDKDDLEVGFNVSYLIDVLNTISGEQVEATLKDSNSSALLKDPVAPEAVYVVMPMRL